jgi:hypothetical protein
VEDEGDMGLDKFKCIYNWKIEYILTMVRTMFDFMDV